MAEIEEKIEELEKRILALEDCLWPWRERKENKSLREGSSKASFLGWPRTGKGNYSNALSLQRGHREMGKNQSRF